MCFLVHSEILSLFTAGSTYPFTFLPSPPPFRNYIGVRKKISMLITFIERAPYPMSLGRRRGGGREGGNGSGEAEGKRSLVMVVVVVGPACLGRKGDGGKRRKKQVRVHWSYRERNQKKKGFEEKRLLRNSHSKTPILL